MTSIDRFLRVRVAAKRPEATDIMHFELHSLDGGPLPQFSAGAHIDVAVADGLVRQYSLANDPAERHRYVLGVLRDPSSRGGSVAMHDRLQVGDTLRISEPRNLFPLDESAAKTLLFAGGIGVTPMLSMAARLNTLGADFEFHYCTRSPDRTAFQAPLREAGFADRVHLHFDDGDRSQHLNLKLLDLEAAQPDTHLYVCGPSGFMDWVLSSAEQAGWPTGRVHSESFGPGSSAALDGADFEVVLNRSGRIVAVPEGKTVVQALKAEGIDIPVSCEQGVCGTCLTAVVDGVPDHRDLHLMPDEQAANDRFLPCRSRSLTPRLVLDL